MEYICALVMYRTLSTGTDKLFEYEQWGLTVDKRLSIGSFRITEMNEFEN
jgi:hypothetical protein